MKYQRHQHIEELISQDTEEAKLLGYLKAYLPQENFDNITSRLEGRGKVEVKDRTYDLNYGPGRLGYLQARTNAVDRYRGMLEVANGFTAIWGGRPGVHFYVGNEQITNENINARVLRHIAKIEGWTEFQFAWWKVKPW